MSQGLQKQEFNRRASRFTKLTLRNLVRRECHGGGDKGEEGGDLEGLHGAVGLVNLSKVSD